MTERDPLVAVLADLARLLLTDFDIEDVLAQLCEAVTGLLPVVGAGVTQVHGDELQVMRSTGAGVDLLERLQASSREGPCRTTIETSLALQVDLRADGDVWPVYARAAGRLGIRRIVAVPLRGRDRVWGVLDLYLAASRPLSESEMESAQVLADAATVYLLSAHDRVAADLAEEQLRSQLLHDPLTGLPNRMLLADRLEHALTVNERPARSLAVLFVDLDGFKRVNDQYGHLAGDVLLTAAANRLVAALRASDTVARLSGDEFVVVCENLHDRPLVDRKDLAALGRRILDALRVPVDVGPARVMLRASVGAVWVRANDDTAADVLHRADSVMYEAKRSGGDRVVVSDPVTVTVSDPVTVPDRFRTVPMLSTTGADVDRAVERDELRAVYQPIVRFSDQGPSGAEALLRWDRPGRGRLRPADFLTAAEQSGAILAIGRWILRHACETLRRTTSADFRISVNVSPVQLRHPDFVTDVVAVLDAAGVETTRLILDVTETDLVAADEAVLTSLRHLAEIGVRLALDDFGTGRSSIASLKQLPVSILKIDPVFVAGIGRNCFRDAAIIKGVTTMAHDLGLSVVAEGIQTEEERRFLVEVGCDAGQGRLFGRPEGHDPGGHAEIRDR